MIEQIISFETAKLAKEKGFNLNSHAYYGCDNPVSGKANQLMLRTWEKWVNFGKEDSPQEGTMIYSSPIQSLLQRWLREKHNIEVYVIPIFRNKCGYDSFKRDGFGFEVIQATPCQYLDWTNFDQSRESRDEITNDEEYHDDIRLKFKTFDTYEDALEVGLNEGLKLI